MATKPKRECLLLSLERDDDLNRFNEILTDTMDIKTNLEASIEYFTRVITITNKDEDGNVDSKTYPEQWVRIILTTRSPLVEGKKMYPV
jgi:hypothetical protein